MNHPRVLVCGGAGGVGKTTTSAALAVALARAGHRTLIVTVDPARRLAQAMGVPIGPEVHPVAALQVPDGTLDALMPEPRDSTQALIRTLFSRQPEAYARFNNNRIYQALQNAMAGIHDLTSLMLIASATEDTAYDYLVVDTAPSRFGLDFITYPGRLANLFEGRAVGWFGTLTQRSRLRESERPGASTSQQASLEPASGGQAPSDQTSSGQADPKRDEGRGLIAWGKRRLEGALSKILDPKTLLDLTHLFGELAIVRRRFSELARTAERLLLGPDTRYLIVAIPSTTADADVRFMANRLASLGPKHVPLYPHAIILNRADRGPPPWLPVLKKTASEHPELIKVLEDLRKEHEARAVAADGMTSRFAEDLPQSQVFRLPTVESRDPTAVVAALTDELAQSLEVLCRL